MKDKIILVHYVYVGSANRSKVIEYMNNYQKVLDRNSPHENMIQYAIPVHNCDSRIECIYPVMVSDKEAIEKMEENLKRFNEAIESQIKVIED